MKHLKSILVFLFLIPLFALAGDISEQVPNEQLMAAVMTLVTQLLTVKGMATVAIAAGVTQLLMLFFKTKLAEFAGKWRLLLVAALTVLSLFLGAIAGGMNWQAALASSPVVLGLQVLVNQIWKQFVVKEA